MFSEEIKAIFKQNNIKSTKQRLGVYDYLLHSRAPITAEMIFMSISRTDADEHSINLSTVYRILDAFQKKGLVVKSNMLQDQKATYEINHKDHRHHLICVKCNAVIPIKGCPLKGYEQTLSSATQYKIIEHRLEILGVCPKCQ